MVVAKTAEKRVVALNERMTIPNEVMHLFEKDPEFAHIVDDISPVGKLIFPIDILAKISKLTPQQKANLDKKFEFVMMPKNR